ncbi:LytTR family DNA-binding domain-containing protein [Pedobacter foliorum]|uniref:LytR/AlgR family response regulator transcription factor n=1 Tax=Pedobacter foliorum TaxID=2739058 RepID=UPI00156439D8|nr:LytTR family DNA-binding domain-containing protein [Pedobacter foliorum]NRF38053.1 response regulator transcription factor [Pedobacter foliorum]
MKVVLIEDERLTAEDLKQTIMLVNPAVEIVAVLKSVKEGKAWFKSNTKPDLIFSDIQLGDGLSFEILSNLHVPVIFCTAYDEYALNAFKVNGIDYLLKPFTEESVGAALQKFKNLTQVKQDGIIQQYESVRRLFSDLKTSTTKALLIHFKDTIIPVSIGNIALFHLENEVVHLLTFDKLTYYPGKSLEELEDIVGSEFFRVNRQYLVNRKAVVNASSLLSRKLSLSVSVVVKESITISKERAPLFLKWLSGRGG